MNSSYDELHVSDSSFLYLVGGDSKEKTEIRLEEDCSQMKSHSVKLTLNFALAVHRLFCLREIAAITLPFTWPSRSLWFTLCPIVSPRAGESSHLEPDVFSNRVVS